MRGLIYCSNSHLPVAMPFLKLAYSTHNVVISVGIQREKAMGNSNEKTTSKGQTSPKSRLCISVWKALEPY